MPLPAHDVFDNVENFKMKNFTMMIILAAAVAMPSLWISGAIEPGISTTLIVGAGITIAVMAWAGRLWYQRRQRRQVLGMRDSALW